MNSKERRKEIEEILKKETGPISGSSLGEILSVSRQVIVGDIALMRASGLKITATPRGYIMVKEDQEDKNLYTIVCKHSHENMGKELYVIVDNGGAILDITVEHAFYGQIVGELQIFSRYDVDLFLEKIEKNKAEPLSKLTGGIHLHTIQYKDREALDRILSALRKDGILVE